jgi:tetratricopeptide (TPR) repeat protein
MKNPRSLLAAVLFFLICGNVPSRGQTRINLTTVSAMRDTSQLRQIIAKYSGQEISAAAQNRLGEILYSSKHYETAGREFLSTYRQYLGKSPVRLRAAYFLGKISFNREKPGDAKSYLGEFLASNPKGTDADWARYFLVRAKFRAGDTDYVSSVKSYFTTSHDSAASHDPTVQYDLIRYLMDHHSYQQSLTEANTMISNYPNDNLTSSVKFKLGIIYEMLGRYNDAVGLYGAIIGTAPSAEVGAKAQFELAGVYDSQNDFANARKEYAKVPAHYPGAKHYVDATACALAMMLYRESLNNPDSAELGEQASEALQGFVTNYPTDRHVPHALMALADLYEKQGNFEEACNSYQKIVDFDTMLIPIKPNAIVRSNDMVAHRELVAQARLSKGNILLDRLQKPQEALAEYQGILAADPNNDVVQLKEAMCYIALGETDQARQALNILVNGGGQEKEPVLSGVKDAASYMLKSMNQDSTQTGGK